MYCEEVIRFRPNLSRAVIRFGVKCYLKFSEDTKLRGKEGTNIGYMSWMLGWIDVYVDT